MAEDGAQVVSADAWEIIPWPRPEIGAGIDEAWRPGLRREPLPIGASDNKANESLKTAWIVGAIPIGKLAHFGGEDAAPTA